MQPIATFTRNSPAYLSDGTQVDANVPRFEQGKFGKAVLVEEGTTNLVNINNFTFNNGASLVDIVHPVTGKTVKAIKLPKGANTPTAFSQDLRLSTNTNYTVSFDMWASDNSNAEINIDLYPDTLPQTSKTPTTNVQRHTWTLSSSNSDMGNCRLRFFDDTSQPMPNDVYIAMIQLEQKPYATSFIDGTGTTNLVNINNFTFNNGASLVDIVHPVTGKTVKAIKLPKGANTPTAFSQDLRLSTNTNYTVSFDMWASDNSNAEINIDLYPDTLPQTSKTPTTNVQRHTWTLSSSNSDMGNCRLRFFDDTSQPMPNDVYIAMIQLEQKPYATSFIDGTRAAETLTIPTAGVLNPQEGTVECWVYIDDRFINGMAGKYAWIWGTKGAPHYPILNLYRNGPTNVLRFVSRDANNNQSYIEKPLSQISVGWHYIACTWESSRLAFLLDGQLVGEVVNPYLPNAVDAQMYIGHNPSAEEQCNSLIDDLRISSRARSDEEILEAYQSGQPAVADGRTTYKADFDEKIC